MKELELQGFRRSDLTYLFEYKPRKGVLVRRVTRAPNAKKGDVVGPVDGKGYLHVNILGKFVRIHRIAFFIWYGGCPPEIDHKDGDRLNNRISNLRPATRTQNAGNYGPMPKNKSGLKGVSQNSRSGKWHAQIKLHGKQTYLGRFDSPIDAARCYDSAAKSHFGEFAYQNNV